LVDVPPPQALAEHTTKAKAKRNLKKKKNKTKARKRARAALENASGEQPPN
jgi:hypothetical protein